MFYLKSNDGRFFSGILSDPWRSQSCEAREYDHASAQRMAAALGRCGHSTLIVRAP